MAEFIRKFGLFARYASVWRGNRRLRRRIGMLESAHRRELAARDAEAKREIDRRDEQLAALQTKLEIVQRESVDRVFEAFRLIGTSYATREADEKIQRLRYEKFDEVRREANKNRLYDSLGPEHRQAYDAEYEAHVRMGEAQGYDKATIERVWREQEGSIVESLTGGGLQS